MTSTTPPPPTTTTTTVPTTSTLQTLNSTSPRDIVYFQVLPAPDQVKSIIYEHPSSYVAVKLPFSSKVRRQTFYHAERIVNKLYSIVGEHVTVILVGKDEESSGGVVLSEHALKSQKWMRTVLVGGAKDGWTSASETVIVKVAQSSSAWLESSNVVQEGSEHSYTCVGGTFDYLHAGHKLLLTMTFYLLSPNLNDSTIIIGLTGAELLKKKAFGQYLTSWSTRCQSVLSYLSSISLSQVPQPISKEHSSLATTDRLEKYMVGGKMMLEVHEIQDPFGPTITMKKVSCLTVSEETREGGKPINEKRTEQGWNELEVFVVGLVGGEGEGKLSSTKIRQRVGTVTSTL